MRRRTVLRVAATSGVGVLAGCTAEGPIDGGTDTPPTESAQSPTSSPTATATPCAVNRVGTAFAVRDVECGTGETTADASVSPTGDATADGDGSPRYTVTVTGTIDGADTCHTARLLAAEALPGEDTLRVSVESYVPKSNETVACADCIVDIDYEATVEFECGYYGTVTVLHDGEQVAELPLPE